MRRGTSDRPSRKTLDRGDRRVTRGGLKRYDGVCSYIGREDLRYTRDLVRRVRGVDNGSTERGVTVESSQMSDPTQDSGRGW